MGASPPLPLLLFPFQEARMVFSFLIVLHLIALTSFLKFVITYIKNILDKKLLNQGRSISADSQGTDGRFDLWE